jgi:hypothetical protein
MLAATRYAWTSRTVPSLAAEGQHRRRGIEAVDRPGGKGVGEAERDIGRTAAEVERRTPAERAGG